VNEESSRKESATTEAVSRGNEENLTGIAIASLEDPESTVSLVSIFNRNFKKKTTVSTQISSSLSSNSSPSDCAAQLTSAHSSTPPSSRLQPSKNVSPEFKKIILLR